MTRGISLRAHTKKSIYTQAFCCRRSDLRMPNPPNSQFRGISSKIHQCCCWVICPWYGRCPSVLTDACAAQGLQELRLVLRAHGAGLVSSATRFSLACRALNPPPSNMWPQTHSSARLPLTGQHPWHPAYRGHLQARGTHWGDSLSTGDSPCCSEWA